MAAIQLSRGRTIVGAPVVTYGVRTVTADTTLTPQDAGVLLIVNATASRTITLPAAALCKGAQFTVVLQAATASGAGHLVDPSGTDQVRGNGFTAANGKGAVNTQATARAGDAITLVSDGSSAWYITNLTGTWAREA